MRHGKIFYLLILSVLLIYSSMPARTKAFSFTDSAEGWHFESYPTFISPVSQWTTGALCLTTNGNQNCFGYWTSVSDDLTCVPGGIYQIQFLVKSDLDTLIEVPDMRLRINTTNWQQSDYLAVPSLVENSAMSPLQHGRWYGFAWKAPIGADRFSISFDLQNFDPANSQNGTLLLSEVRIVRLDDVLFNSPVMVKSYTFEESSEGWNWECYPDYFSEPFFEHVNGSLQIQSSGNINTFGSWRSPSEIIIDPDKPYRIRAFVSSDSASRENVPAFRLRMNMHNESEARVLVVESIGSGDNSPTTDGAYYEFYFYPPSRNRDQMAYVSFDLMNFGRSDAPSATLRLESVTVENFAVE